MDYKKKKIFKKSLLLSSVILCILAVFLVLFILYINSLVKKETLGELSRLSKKSVSIINSNIENELNRTQSAANILSHCIGNTVELEASVDYIANANGYTSFAIAYENGESSVFKGNIPGKYMGEMAQEAAIAPMSDMDGLLVSAPVKSKAGNCMIYAIIPKENASKNIFGILDSDNCALVSGGSVILSSSKSNGISEAMNSSEYSSSETGNGYQWAELKSTDQFYTLSDTSISGWQLIDLYNSSELAVRTKHIAKICSIVIIAFSLILLTAVLKISAKDEKAKLEMYRLAFVDSLTGLYTSEKFRLDGEKLLEGTDNRYAAIVTDIDNFKLVNDLFGHSAGDKVLLNISNVLRRSSREDEMICRINNDCFGLLLKCGGDENDFLKRVEDILRKMCVMPDNRDYHLKASCGVYYIDKTEVSMSTAIDSALIAMKSIKTKNQHISVYDKKLISKMLEEKALEDDLDTALENGEFLVYLQPKYNLKTDELAGAEALVRWKHHEKGMLSPGVFIPLFETNGSIAKIDLYMLDKVAAKIRQWIDNGKKLYTVSVNLSRVQLNNPKLAEELDKIVSKYDIPKNLINFELTESAYFDDVNKLVSTMDSLKSLGYSISMDDFGTGYSSLSLLKQMPLDVLKLDKSFLYGWDKEKNNPKQISFITDIIQMAQHLEIETLAEGVETEEQRDFLKSAGCELVQGFFYARPVPVDEYEKMIS